METKKRKNKTGFWSNEKVLKYFNKLCKKSEKRTVDWKKFRQLDKKGIFNEYNLFYLRVKRNQVMSEVDIENSI